MAPGTDVAIRNAISKKIFEAKQRIREAEKIYKWYKEQSEEPLILGGKEEYKDLRSCIPEGDYIVEPECNT